MFLEQEADGQLRLSRQCKRYRLRTEDGAEERPYACSIEAVCEGQRLALAATGEPDVLRLRSQSGWAEICFDSYNAVRLKGGGMTLGLSCSPEWSMTDLQDGTFALWMDELGAFLIVPLEGAWRLEGQRLMGSGETFEVCLHYAHHLPLRRERYRPFPSCQQEARRDFDAWQAMYPVLLPEHEAIRQLAAYSVWICQVEPIGIMKGPLMLYRKNDSAFCWQAAYHAMSIWNDADMAIELLYSIFAWQDEWGQLPDLADDLHVEFLSTKPPMQGFAFLFLLQKYGNGITKAHCEKLYLPFARWFHWWMHMRDSDGDGIAQYNQGCECAMDTSAMLDRGTPAECPDLTAYLILLAEALAQMACRMERRQEAQEWSGRAQRMLEGLVCSFWDGERFAARLSGSHEIIRVQESDVYTPLILGKRLPAGIIRKMAQDLRDDYLTPIGIRHAPAHLSVPLGGIVGSFWQVKLVIGLYDAGEKELAMEIARRYLKINVQHLPALGYPAAYADGKSGGPAHASAVTALPCGIFFILAGLLREWTEETEL